MKSRQKGIISLVLMVVLSLALVFTSDSIYDALKQQSQTAAGSTEGNAIETSAAGFGGDVVVSTVIGDDGSIAGISIVDCSTETDTIGQAAAPEIAKAIVEAQSLDVDSVAGATVTSDAVKAAVEAAVAEAGLDVAAFKAGEEAGSEAAGETEESSEEISEAAGETEESSEEVTESVSETEEASEAASEAGEETSEATSEAAEENTETSGETAADVAMPAGEYEASAPGYGGDVKVGVIVNADGSIGAVKILDMSSETPDVGQAAAPEVAKQIVLAQSADVDGVSGATVTSNAVIEAAALAFTGSGSPAEGADKEALEEAAEESSDASEEAEKAADDTEAAETGNESAAGTEKEEVSEITVPAGEYEASAPGYGGDVKVGVTVNADGSIGAVKILDMSSETPDVGQAAAPEVAGQIVLAQSADVDGVSGATVTGDAIAAAVAAALAGEGTSVQ